MRIGIISAVVVFAVAPSTCATADDANPAATLLYLDQSGWGRASGEAKAALAADFMRVFCGNPAMPPTDLVNCLDRSGDAGSIFPRAMACLATVPIRQ